MADLSSDSLHEAIQRALTTGDFEKTRELSGTLGQAIIREAQSAPSGERRMVFEKGLSRLREHLSLARVLRAHVSSLLKENTGSSLYHQSPARGHSWRIDG